MIFSLSSLELGLLIFGIVLGSTLVGIVLGRWLAQHSDVLRERFAPRWRSLPRRQHPAADSSTDQ
jgi:hypothetical protein